MAERVDSSSESLHLLSPAALVDPVSLKAGAQDADGPHTDPSLLLHSVTRPELLEPVSLEAGVSSGLDINGLPDEARAPCSRPRVLLMCVDAGAYL
jgi:hypothetical protein